MTLNFRSGEIGYDIVVERGALDHIAQLIDLNRKILVVSDSGVPAEYTQKVLAACPQGFSYVFPKGEENKDITVFAGILSELLKDGFTRTDAVIAVGGGVVGDISGFAAACFMRGIEFYNVPTTLLSQVDSSIGGKTAIDFGGVKNIVGAFHHPSKVIIDPNTLNTLNDRLLHEGLAEAIKMAATSNARLFEQIRDSYDIRVDIDNIIVEALKIKMNVVAEDPTEKGLRRVLNFGHTIGHAIEAAAAGEYFHGECVAAGMMYMASEDAGRQIEAVLKKYDLPYKDSFDTDTLMSYISHDKKKSGSGITTVYVGSIGSFEFRKMGMDDIKACIDKFKKR